MEKILKDQDGLSAVHMEAAAIIDADIYEQFFAL